MAIWQWALLLLALVWALQSLGVWLQMRHYSDVMKGISKKYAQGYVGAGNAKGRLGKGVIVLVVVDEHLRVQRLLKMSGRSVFAKFARAPEFEGLTLAELQAPDGPIGTGEQGFATAVARAVEQIEAARSRAKASEADAQRQLHDAGA